MPACERDDALPLRVQQLAVAMTTSGAPEFHIKPLAGQALDRASRSSLTAMIPSASPDLQAATPAARPGRLLRVRPDRSSDSMPTSHQPRRRHSSWSVAIAEIEREVKARSALAERLQEDVERHRELLKLNRSEVDAVAQTLGVEVRREGRRSFWVSLAINAAFFGLGVLVTLLLT